MTAARSLNEIKHVLLHTAGIGGFFGHEAFPDFDEEVMTMVLDEAARMSDEIFAPLNPVGDTQGSQLVGDGVKSPEGFKAAYQAFAEAGWVGLPFPESYGGQALPKLLSTAVMDILNSGNLSLTLCPTLSLGAIDALMSYGTEFQQKVFLPKLVSGEWTGTMNLTEPQAGSDVGALKTKAEPNGDGTYAITGQKIYISWGDHDMAENIIHLVLARLPNAPDGTKGISLFLVPKTMVDEDGNLGAANAVKPIGVEHKMGLHASPTCVMEYSGATGWLVGEENRGMMAMFVMMNNARLQVGLQGTALCEAAYWQALDYAADRVQGKAAGVKGNAAILHHPDVQNMLIKMRAYSDAARSLSYEAVMASDLAENATSDTERKAAKLKEDILTPIAKSWPTDAAVDVTSLGVQVHGGMGYMAETQAGQLYRDSRIPPIYEGTNGIQAIDLAGRKLGLEGGQAVHDLFDTLRTEVIGLKLKNLDEVPHIDALIGGLELMQEETRWMQSQNEPFSSLMGATAYQRQFGSLLASIYLMRGAILAKEAGAANADDKLAIAKVFASYELPGYASTRTRVRLAEVLSSEVAKKLVGLEV
tara:strand:+ start:15847 stop:17610 length:1764 start_codon:yes stop_codon:yes gene_type:complete